MASPTRNPKDLRTIVSSNQTDGDRLHASIEKLTISPSEENREIAMLRSRIDEQGQLICILKKRADEFVVRNQTLDNINNELELLREQASDEIKSETKRADMLESRFNELAENHEEMIKYKDEHKRRNQLLLEENAKLLKENQTLFSGAIQEKNTIISNLESSIDRLRKEMQQAAEERNALNKILEDTNLNLRNEIVQIKKELKATVEKLNKSETAASTAKAERDVAKAHKDDSFVKLKKENNHLLEQVMQRGKLLQERQSDIEKLEKEIEVRDTELDDAEEKFQLMEDRVNVNSRVRKLQAERDIADAELSQLKREYEAYRVHSNKLLIQEKDLNYKLRRNILV